MRIKLQIVLIGFFSLISCSGSNYKSGDIYSVEYGDGKIGIVKVLVVEPALLHLRLYKNKFETRPEKIDTRELSFEVGFGIGHIPLNINEFKDWNPVLITNEKITPEELEGFNLWKESQ